MANNYDTTTKFKVDISELKSAMQEAKRQIQVTNSEFKAISSSMDDWSKSTDGISAKIKQLDTNLKSQKTILRSLEDQYELTVQQMGEGSKEADNLKIAINNQQAVINKTEKELQEFNEELKKVEKAELEAVKSGREVSDVLGEMEDETEDATQGFTVMKGVLADLVAEGIKTAISALKDMAASVIEVGSNFSTSMAEVQAISGASADELEQLEATAREFGATTVFSASESADALKYMALAGWSVEQSTSALGGVLNLAAASGMGLAEASDMVTDYLSAFGMEAQESAYFADMLSYAQSHSNTSAAQLGEAFKNCAANLNAAGQDVETTTALLAAMANQGLKGSEAGTALTAVMRDMTSKMSPIKDEADLARLGLEGMTDMIGKNIIAIGDQVVTVSDANGNFRDLTDILKDVENATNGMGDAEKASALMATFTSDSIKGLNLILNDGVDKATDFEEALRNSGGSAENMANIMNDNLAGDVKAFQSALEELSLKVYDVLEPVLRDVIAFVQELANEFNAWLADPENQKAIEELGTKLTEFAEGALTAVMDGIKWFIENKDTVIAGLVAIAAGFAAFKVVGLITSVISAIKNLGTALTVLKAIMAALGGPVTIIITIIAALVAGFITLWNTSDEFRNFWIGLWETISSAFSAVGDFIVNFFTVTIPETFNKAVTAIGEFISSAGESIKEFFTVKIPEFIQTALDWFNDLPYKIGYALGYVLGAIIKWAADTYNTVKTKVPEIIAAVVKFFSELPAKISQWLVNTLTKISEWAVNTKNKASEAGKNFIETVVSFIKDLPTKVKTWLDESIKKLTTWVSDMKAKGKDGITDLINAVVDGAKEIPSKMLEIGTNIVNGVWNGIKEAKDNFKKNVGSFFSGIVDGVKDGLGIHSPSKVFADEVGKWIPEGIAVGIDKNAKSVLSAMQDLTANSLGAARNGLAVNGGSGITGGVVNNFYQTNNSPKALSRLEIYRQSKNLLSYAGGV